MDTDANHLMVGRVNPCAPQLAFPRRRAEGCPPFLAAFLIRVYSCPSVVENILNFMSTYLEMVNGPEHVKKLTLPQLQELAAEIRQELIAGLSKAGGHLGPNLGVVELTIALHRVFNTPRDKFVWDVSHQVYVHKILTDRKDRFRTIRQTDGLNGFALRTESPHDCYGAGHAGTALSAALGMAAARDKNGTDENVVCIFGDAALTNGISFEALNNIGHTTSGSSAS